MSAESPLARGPGGTWEPLDLAYLRDFATRVYIPILDHYFRPALIGAEKLPTEGPVILAANHSGNAFPHDAVVLDATLWRHDGLAPEKKLRTAFEKELTAVWWMRPFGLDNWWRRCGGVDMTFDNFDRSLARGDRVLYFPEGVPGIGKGFNRRYRLQRFSTSFALLAARRNVAVYPVYVVNAEWVHPFGYCVPALDRLMQRWLGVPFLPLPIGLLTLLFPWMFYLSFPARMTFVVGDRLDVAALAREAGITDFAARDRERWGEVAKRIRLHMQAELDRCVAQYGRRPWDVRSLTRELWKERRRLLALVPLGWPVTFVRHERNLRRAPARSRLRALLRDWDLLGYYLPLGWLALALTRSLRRPPCGYRGLPPEDAREQRGDFVWRLAERPLPARAGAASGAPAAPGEVEPEPIPAYRSALPAWPAPAPGPG
jgi:1-acyl-sn-glycerol-3-phosphate acyltransferase